jgi:predicted nuclease with TOPRIM domain
MSFIFLIGCTSKTELDSALADLDSALMEISSLESKTLEQENTIKDYEDQLSTLVAENENLIAKNELLNQDYESLVNEKDELQSKYRENNLELTEANIQLEKLICDEQLDQMEYNNIFDASTILAGWWALQPSVSSVRGTYRDHIWSNADTKIHAIQFISSNDNEQYVEHFLVYFDEFGMKPGVFWVGGQCWLDVP